MKIRLRKEIDESIKTIREIEPTREAIAQYLRDQWGGLGYGVYPQNITVEPYCFDPRVQTNVYMVLLDGYAVAFTDSPILPDPQESSSPSNQP